MATRIVEREAGVCRSLVWEALDESGFRECLEPDARQLREIRNTLEHKYLKLHEAEWLGPPPPEDEVSQALADTLAFSMHRADFMAKGLRLLKMARAALIYLALAVHCEERRRARERGPNGIVPGIRLDVWEDEWKV